MEIHIDQKGKVFTPHVAKIPQRAMLTTTHQLICGSLHIAHDRRLKDEVNTGEARFLAITDAQVYTIDGHALLYSSDFMLVAYSHIVSICPADSISVNGDPVWGHDLHKEAQ